MARRVRSPKLETRTARLDKLKVRKKPYSVPVAPGVILLYRRNHGAGTWGVRLTDGKDQTHRLALADDYAEADGRDVLDFWQAQDAARARAGEYAGDAAPVTVAAALDQYEADLRVRGGDLGNVKRARSHAPPAMLDRIVSSLKAGELRQWRDGLAEALAPASVNRTATCLKAALNLAAARDERITRRPWESGLRALPDAETARNLILPDTTVRAIVQECYRPNAHAFAHLEGEAREKIERETARWSDAFGLLVEVLAVTGARVSQAARLEVRDVQGDRADPRLMLPSSKKGRGTKKVERRPVPIPADLALRLRTAATSRSEEKPLLAKPNGQPWERSDHDRPFERAIGRLRTKAQEDARKRGGDAGAQEKVARALEGVTVYALRHSSIVRQLLANVPIRIVAVNHDTSVAMIEKNYSRFISDHADAMARKALLDVSARPGSNIVTIGAVAG